MILEWTAPISELGMVGCNQQDQSKVNRKRKEKRKTAARESICWGVDEHSVLSRTFITWKEEKHWGPHWNRHLVCILGGCMLRMQFTAIWIPCSGLLWVTMRVWIYVSNSRPFLVGEIYSWEMSVNVQTILKIVSWWGVILWANLFCGMMIN
jgi:hypothetical protein